MQEYSFTLLNGRTVGDRPGRCTYCSTLGRSVIDLAWFSSSYLGYIADLQVDPTVNLSDHFPLTLFLNFATSAVSIQEPTRDCLRVMESVRLRWDDHYSQQYALLMGASPRVVYSSELAPGQLENNLRIAIKETSAELGFVKKVNYFKTPNRQNAWYDRECLVLKRRLRSSLNKCFKLGFSPVNKRDYLETKKLYRQTIVMKKCIYEKDVMVKLSNVKNTVLFWNTIREFRRCSCRPDLSVETWEDFYTAKYFLKSSPHCHYFDAGHPELDKNFTLEELSKALSKCRSPGTDGIAYEFYKQLPQNWLLYVCCLFNRIMDTEIIPEEWSKVILIMLHKKGPIQDPSNYRSIALVNTITKVFTQILLARLVEWAEVGGVLPECQSGFRKGRGCMDNIYTLTAIIHLNVRFKGRSVYAAFIDFKQAFDTVDHGLLWQKMYHVGVSAKLIRLISRLYKDSNVRVCSNGRYSKSFPVNEGVLQGESLSPFLFSLFLADIEKFYRDRGFEGLSIDSETDVLLLLYADDLVILGRSPVDLDRKLRALEEYARRNKLTVNTEKSKVVIFSKANIRPAVNFRYQQEPIEIVKEFSYLGVTFSSSCLFLRMATAACGRARQSLGAVMSLMSRTKLHSWDSRLQLYESIVINALTYCLSVWGPRYPDVIERIQVSFFKRMLLLQKTTPDCYVRLETGCIRLSYHTFKQCLLWLLRLYAMPESRYPRRCFDRLKRLESLPEKYNWCSQVRHYFDLVGCSDLWENLTYGSLRRCFSDLLNRYREFLCQQDVISFTASHYSPFTRVHSGVLATTKYLRLQMGINVTRILTQLRLSSKKHLKLSINGGSHFVNCAELCTICNLEKLETLHHIVFECPVYEGMRSLLPPLWVPVTICTCILRELVFGRR